MPETCKLRERSNLSGTDRAFSKLFARSHLLFARISILKCRLIKAIGDVTRILHSIGFGAELAGGERATRNEGERHHFSLICIRNEHGKRVACLAVLSRLYGLLRIPHPLFARILKLLHATKCPQRTDVIHLRASFSKHATHRFLQMLLDSVVRISDMT